MTAAKKIAKPKAPAKKAAAKGKAARKPAPAKKAAKQQPLKFYPLAVIPPKPEPTRRERFQAWASQPDLAAIGELAEFIADGHDLAEFCRGKDFAYVTVMDWIRRDTKRADIYDAVRIERAHKFADEIRTISDEPCETPVLATDIATGQLHVVGVEVDAAAVQRNRLRADSRKWLASRLMPKVYGDKLELDGKLKTETMSDDDLVRKLHEFGVIVPPLGEAPATDLGNPMTGFTVMGQKVH